MALPDSALDRLKAAFVSTNSGEADGAPALRVRTVGAVPISGALTVTSTGSSALAVGANGATNPVLQVDASAASVATGLRITGAAAGGGVALAAISSGAAEALSLAAKGAAALTLLTNSTTRVTIASTGAVTIAAPDSGTGLTVNGPTKLGRTDQADITTIYGYNEGSINTTVVLDNPGSTGSGTSLTFQTAEANRAVIDSTTAANGGAQLRLYTRNAAGSIVQRLAIASTGAVTIASPDSGTGLSVSSVTPASVASGNGTAGDAVLALTWGNGGAVTTATGTVVGGAAASQSFTLGTGGAASGASTQNTGGAGASWTFVCGAGGAATGATTNIGGAGGGFTVTTGNSGAGAQGNVNGGNFTVNLGTATGSGTAGIFTLVSTASTTHNITTTTGDVVWQVFANDTAGAGVLTLKAGNGTTSSNAVYVSSQINATTAQRWDFGCVSSTSWSVKDVTRNASPLTINLTGNVTIAAPSSGVALTISGGGLSVTGDLTIGDANNLVLNATTGTKIGTATSQKLAFYNSTPVVQPVGAGQAAVIATAATQTTPWGYATQAQADAIVTLVNQLRADLVTLGLIKGAA